MIVVIDEEENVEHMWDKPQPLSNRFEAPFVTLVIERQAFAQIASD